ncbi:MAG: DUF5752 family protein [Candidatus Nitrospinota bacterium M3_3B_026]
MSDANAETGGTEDGAGSFTIRDCALIAIATGRKAQNLKELRLHLQTVDPSSVYFHFWGGLLRPGFEEREYHNDFAEWVRHEARDFKLGERLSAIDPSEYSDMDELRLEMLEIIEERLDETEFLTWAHIDRQFEFIRSQIVVFDTKKSIDRPENLGDAVSHMSTSSVFYHFIDSRRRPPEGIDDFRAWLEGWGDKYSDLIARLADVDPYFVTLVQLREQIASIFTDYFGEGR